MPRQKKQIKQIIREVSLRNISNHELLTFTNDEVEDYVSSFIVSGEWELMLVQCLGNVTYPDDRGETVKMLYVLKRINE